MSIYYKTAIRETKEVRPGSPAQAEEIVAAGVPIGGLPGLGPNEKAILRLALNPHSGGAQAVAERLAKLRNLNIRSDTPPWLLAEAARSVVAQSWRWHAPDPPNPYEPKPSRRGFWLDEGGPVVIPSSGDGQKKVDNGLPIQKLDDGLIIEFDIPIWLMEWETFLQSHLPYRMREIFRVDDFYPPPMSRGAPVGPPKSFDYVYGDRFDEQFTLADIVADPRGDPTAGQALRNVFLEGLKLDATERLIYLASVEDNATPQDLTKYLGISADAARKRQKRLFERVAKEAPESDSDFIWQPGDRPGPYSGRNDKRGREDYRRFMAQCTAVSDEGKLRRRLIDIYADAELVRRILEQKRRASANSALHRWGGGKSLNELGRRAWTEPTLGPLERAPMSLEVYSSDNDVIATGCDRSWSAIRGTRGQPHEQTERLDAPQDDLDRAGPSREHKPRCLERGCSRQVAAKYESRDVPRVNSETQPHWIKAPKEKADAHLRCKRHLQERKETMEVTQTEIAAGFSDLDSKLSIFQEETRRGISQMLTALTWKFPDDEELLDAVDDWRRQIGDIGVRAVVDE